MVSLATARKRLGEFATEQGDSHRLLDMQIGCHRRWQLAQLGPEDDGFRDYLTRQIAAESQGLFS